MNKPIMAAILSCQGTSLNDEEKKFFAQNNPLGINIFSRNIASKQQLKKLINEIKEVIGRDDVLIAIDQEGGRVRRLAEPEFRPYTSAISLGSLPIKDAKEASSLHTDLICSDLQEMGINVNYAPVLDIYYSDTSPALKSRCLSDDSKIVTTLGKIMVDCYIKNGISPCIKHMPGHGRASVDPHLHMPIINSSLKELEQDFLPFQKVNYSPMGMTAHIVISAVDDKHPITQSKKGIQTIIRDIIGFNGLLISDAIDMKALKGSVGEKAKVSINSGCDCICYALGDINEMQDIANNCPSLNDKALERFYALKKILQPNKKVSNIKEKEQKYQTIIGKISPYKEEYDSTEVLNKMMQNQKQIGE